MINHNLTDLAWEYQFNEEALKVEELLNKGLEIDYSKSRLRLALENEILSWPVYKKWFFENNNYSCLNENIGPSDLVQLNEIYSKNSLKNSDLKLSSDQIFLTTWQDKNIILGLSTSHYTKSSDHIIFILCSNKILNAIVDQDYSAQEINSTWNEIQSQHHELCIEARKNFDAFVVLKIEKNETFLFKADEDLARENVNIESFKFSLKETNPFTAALLTEKIQDINLADLNLKILDYTTGSITLIKRGKIPVGFFVGLKTTAIKNEDHISLENLSFKIS